VWEAIAVGYQLSAVGLFVWELPGELGYVEPRFVGERCEARSPTGVVKAGWFRAAFKHAAITIEGKPPF